MDDYRMRVFAAHAAYAASQMSLFNSLSSPSLSQALTAASMPSSFSTTANMSGTASALSRAWLSSSTDSSDSVSTSREGVRSQSPGDQRPASTSGQQQHRVMTCPLCGLSLEGSDVSSHFYEEVSKMETLRSTLRIERLHHWGNKDPASSSHSPLGLSLGAWTPNGDPVTDHHHHPHHRMSRQHHSLLECVDTSACKRLRFPGDKMQPCSRWQTYQRVRQNRQSRLEGLLRCKQRSQRIDDRQEKSSTTSSPQASPSSIICSNGNSAGGNNNNNISEGKTNGHGRIWSIVGDIEVRQDNSISSSRNWSPIRLQEEKEILRDKTRDLADLSQTIISDDHIHSKKLGIESDSRSFDERSDAASSGNETSVDVEVEVI